MHVCACMSEACLAPPGSLAQSFQHLQGASDVPNLPGQALHGLQGPLQLLAARQQRVHALDAHVHRLAQGVHGVAVGLDAAHAQGRQLLHRAAQAAQ